MAGSAFDPLLLFVVVVQGCSGYHKRGVTGLLI